MFLKNNDLAQNHKLMFIGMLIIIILVGIMIFYKNAANKERLLEEQKKVQEKTTTQENVGANFLKKPITTGVGNSAKEEKDGEAQLNSILSKNLDKKKLLFFFASWNKESIIMLEHLKKLAIKVKDSTKIVVIEVEGSTTYNLSFQDSGIDSIKCTDSILPAKYLVDAIPSMIVLSKNNNVSSTHKGSLSYDEILNLTN